jgi:hypothetical protein
MSASPVPALYVRRYPSILCGPLHVPPPTNTVRPSGEKSAVRRNGRTLRSAADRIAAGVWITGPGTRVRAS